MALTPAEPGPSGPVVSAEPRLAWRELLILFIGSRLAIVLTAAVSLLIVKKGPFYTPPGSCLDWFTRWDAGWFLDVAQHGYHFTRLGESNNIPFLPLYPLVVRVASLGGLIPLNLAGYLVSLGCLWTACVWLWRVVVREWGDPKLATRAVTFLLCGPVNFFFSCIYSEALFLPLAIGCIALARQRRWWLAGLLGALAASTRIAGVLLIIPMGWELLIVIRSEGRGRWRAHGIRLVACGLPALGLAAYCLLMWVQFGDPLMYVRGQAHWGRHFAWWWDLFARASFTGQPLFYQIWFAGAVVIAFSLLALGVWLRVPATYLIWGLATAFIALSSRLPEGLPRYLSVIFPLYFVVALLVRRWPALLVPLLVITLALQTLSVTLFVNGYWFT